MKLSVLLCIYNGDSVDYFIDAYTSILDQTLLPDQIVLVIDGPVNIDLENSINQLKTKSLELSVEFNDVWLPENMGHGYAREQGVLNCKYDLVAIADADDVNDINRFSIQKSYLESNPEISIVGSQILEVDHADLTPISKKLVPQYHNDIVSFLKLRCPFNQMSVMFRRKDVILSGNYITFFHNEDYYLWLRMFLKGYKFHNLPEFLVKARINESFYSRRGGVKYFLSECKLQKFMFDNKITTFPVFLYNCIVRFAVQVFMPGSLRKFVFAKFFRSQS